MHYINHNLKFYRKYKRYTQADIADMLYTTVGRIKSYENNKAVPQVEMMLAIADMMNVSLDTLVKVKLSSKSYGKHEVHIESLERRLKALEKTRSVLDKKG